MFGNSHPAVLLEACAHTHTHTHTKVAHLIPEMIMRKQNLLTSTLVTDVCRLRNTLMIK
jgi:hypothetical protein